MSAYRPHSWGRFGRVPDAPEPIERDCEHCKHYVKQNEGNTEALFGELYGCELWDCDYKRKEEEK